MNAYNCPEFLQQFFLFFFHKRIFAYKIFKVLRSKHAVLDLENSISAGNSQYAIIWVEKKEKRLRKKEKRSASLILPGIKKIILFCLPCPICYSAINFLLENFVTGLYSISLILFYIKIIIQTLMIVSIIRVIKNKNPYFIVFWLYFIFSNYLSRCIVMSFQR